MVLVSVKRRQSKPSFGFLVSSQPRQDDVLVEFLTEFANHLLKCGVTTVEFRFAAQAAFVQAALGSARLGNARVNQSAVAAVTGLSRTQVRTLLRNPSSTAPQASTRINAVISGWRSDPNFTNRDGKPRALSLDKGINSFRALISKYGRDVSHRAMLSEMMRLGFVRRSASKLLLRRSGTQAQQPEMTRLLSQGLTHVIRGASDRDGAVLNVITGEAKTIVSSRADKILLQRRLVQGTKAFAADIQAASDATASRRKRTPRGESVRTKILVVAVGSSDDAMDTQR